MSSLIYSPWLGTSRNLTRIPLSPFLSGPLLLAVTYAPDVVRDALIALASRVPWVVTPSSSLDLSTAKTVLRVLLALGIIRQLNRILSVWAANSWRLVPAKGWDWPNEIAVVTGGSSGIGKDVVDRLVAMDVRVAVFDVQDVPKSLKENPRVWFYKCDVTSSESVAAAADSVRRDLGHPSILINNAGITKPMPILKMPESFLRKIFGVNTMALWFTTQQFLPRMIQLNKGHVMTVASLASFVALPTGADYSATKAGALSFHESLRLELKHYYKAPSVLTTVVHPNFVRTPLVDSFSGGLEKSGVRMLTSEQIADPIISQIRSRRGGQLIMPEHTDVVCGIRGWPTWLQELLRDIMGRASSQL